jgi:hypothetical protein
MFWEREGSNMPGRIISFENAYKIKSSQDG